MTDERQPPGQPNGQADRPDERLDERLDVLFRQLGVERAPPGLTRRLHRIPREEGYRSGWHRLFRPAAVPRWVLAPALAAALLAVGVVLTLPRGPSEAEVLQARRDLALAFRYVDRAGVITGREIKAALGGELRDPVKDNLSKHIPFTEQSLKEETS